MGVKRKQTDDTDGGQSVAKKYRVPSPPPDPAAAAAAAKAAEAKAALEAKIKAAQDEAAKMKRSIEAAAKAAQEKKEAAAREAAAKAALERKEKELEKANRAKKASNLLSGFASARKRHGVGTAEGAAAAEAAEAAAAAEAALTPEEVDRRAVRRVMMAGTDWAILDLPPNAQAKWVKQSYRELARVLHPDKCRAPGAKDAFQKLLRAYQNITNAQG